MQFYAVHSDALALTHDALQRYCHHQGMRPVGPTRVLRVAQLYGHLQLRCAGRERFSLALSELAASWRLQPRQLRQDLELLQQLGWLRASGTSRGTVIELLPPQLPALAAEPAGQEALEPASPQAPGRATATATAQKPVALAAAPADPSPAGPPPAAPAPVVPSPRRRCSTGSSRCEGRALLLQFAALYNRHRPPSWPAYQPRGTALLRKLRLALRQAGGAEALAAALTTALAAMPPFWRHTYPQGRSGAECMAVLFHSDRACAGLGVEFWHLFRWADAARAGATPEAAAPSTAQATAGAVPTASADGPYGPLLHRAQRLFLWESGQWRGQGTEALRLSLAEKRALTQLLESHGQGIAGTAARQFAEQPVPDPSPHAP